MAPATRRTDQDQVLRRDVPTSPATSNTKLSPPKPAIRMICKTAGASQTPANSRMHPDGGRWRSVALHHNVAGDTMVIGSPTSGRWRRPEIS